MTYWVIGILKNKILYDKIDKNNITSEEMSKKQIQKVYFK